MGPRTWVVAAFALMVGLASASPAAGQSPAGAICPTVVPMVDVPEGMLADAQAAVERIFESIGVSVEWEGQSGCRTSLVVRIVSDRQVAGMERSGTALGFAIIPAKIAYVVYDRVERYATERRFLLADALSLVIAHEIGHLLIGRNAHATDGLMRASWSYPDFQRAVNGDGFSSADVHTIQARLAGGD